MWPLRPGFPTFSVWALTGRSAPDRGLNSLMAPQVGRPGWREDFGRCGACSQTNLPKRFPAWPVDEDGLLNLGLLAQSPEPIHCRVYDRLHSHSRDSGQHERNYARVLLTGSRRRLG